MIVLYSTLGIIAAVLMLRHARRGIPDEPAPTGRTRRHRTRAPAAAAETSQLTY